MTATHSVAEDTEEVFRGGGIDVAVLLDYWEQITQDLYGVFAKKQRQESAERNYYYFGTNQSR